WDRGQQGDTRVRGSFGSSLTSATRAFGRQAIAVPHQALSIAVYEANRRRSPLRVTTQPDQAIASTRHHTAVSPTIIEPPGGPSAALLPRPTFLVRIYSSVLRFVQIPHRSRDAS
ncbi:hypothetical protein Dimus_007906, partial [Dionaea muscipula]